MTTEMAWQGDFIEGSFLKPKDPNGEVFSKNPGDLEETPIRFPFCYDHVKMSVESAAKGFSSWSKSADSDRMAAVSRYNEHLKKNADRIAFSLSLEGGKPLWEAREEVSDTTKLIDFLLTQPPQTGKESEVPIDPEKGIVGQYRYFARGPMAIISPSAIPLFHSHSSLIPALLAGNTVVVKSSKFNPVTGQLMAEVAREAELPPGVFNVIHGDAEVAKRLVKHNGIQGVFFTGSHEKSMRLRKELLSDYWKIFIHQGGGKNASILWEDGNYEKALYDSLYSAFVTTGQRYSSTRFVLVHDKHFDKFREDLHLLAKKCPVGYGPQESDPPVFMGPLLSEAKVESYLRYQGIAVREGCEEVMRGKALEKDRRGNYVSPSIHIVHKVDPKSAYQKEEIFGPNIALYRVKTLDEIIETLNLRGGLAHAVYTQKRDVYLKLVHETRVGLFHWNLPTTTTCFQLPISGLGRSGSHRPMGSLAMQQCAYPVSSMAWENAKNEIPAVLPKL